MNIISTEKILSCDFRSMRNTPSLSRLSSHQKKTGTTITKKARPKKFTAPQSDIWVCKSAILPNPAL